MSNDNSGNLGERPKKRSSTNLVGTGGESLAKTGSNLLNQIGKEFEKLG
jgi:hypothetical protein